MDAGRPKFGTCIPCVSDDSCRSDICLPEPLGGGSCVPACAGPADCPANWDCRAVYLGDLQRMACVPGTFTCSELDFSSPADGGPTAAPPLPHVQEEGADALSAPELVTITFDDYPLRTGVESFGDAMVGSAWLRAVGAEYGVVQATHRAKVHLPGSAPASLTEDDINALLGAKLDDGTLPAPTGAVKASTIYMLYLGPNTSVSQSGGASCTDYGGYHTYFLHGTVAIPYALVFDCPYQTFVTDSALDGVTATASHEFIEAATDPFPSYYPGYQIYPPDPWGAFGGEVADLCSWSNTREGSFTYQRSWSNAAASDGGTPCVPADMGEPYHNVYAPGGNTVMLPPDGGAAHVALTGWAARPMSRWPVLAFPGYTIDFVPEVALYDSVGSGETVTLSVSAPAGTPSGKGGMVLVESLPADGEENAGVYVLLVVTP